jgi:predicted aspartyl protease
MRKLGFLFTAIIVGMILVPGSALALSVMSESQLRQTTGQAGIVMTAEDKVGLNMDIKTLAYGDTDGTYDGKAAYLSLNDIQMRGSITLRNPVSTTVTTEMDPYANTMLTGINIQMNGAVVEMNRLHIGSITVGDQPGAGKSFGSITVEGFRAEISGNVRITARP